LSLAPIAAEEVGNRISSANEFYEKLGGDGNGGVDLNANYSLACNIDLTDYRDSSNQPVTTGWVGPSGYQGHFYGNGYTITGLVLDVSYFSGSNNKAGLFKSLGDGAVLENFTLEVSTPNNQPTVAPRSGYFGGLLAYISDATVGITVQDVKVKGNLKIACAPSAYLILFGGFFGEARDFKSITMIRCSSEVNIEAEHCYGPVGGFVGRMYSGSDNGSLSFTDCYASGNVTANTTSYAIAGGFIGDVNGSTLTMAVTFERCYASGNVEVTAGANSYAGGFIGGVPTASGCRNLYFTIKDCAAVGTKAIVSPSTGYGRLAGYANDANNTITFTNNIANAAMQVGDGSTHTDDGDDAQGITKWGKGVANDTNGLRKITTWTAAAPTGLGWSTDTWDFSGLSQGKWPTLK
ncbi:MAG: hypothetical protein LBG74_06895, partial [Spirochaetaceae bacterium]|nr:hypothetical protein [Spirochaetaceae bacterium]